MQEQRQFGMGINGSMNEPGFQANPNINKSGDVDKSEDEQYIPVDEMYPEAAAQEVPLEQRALVPVNKRPRKIPQGQRNMGGGNGGGPRMMNQQQQMYPQGMNQQQQMYPQQMNQQQQMYPQEMNQVQQFNQVPMQNNGQMMMFPGPQGQNMQLVPVANNQVGQLMPFEPQEKKKKWSLTEWEDKRMRHTSGRMCVNVMYCLATLLMIIMFIALFTDIWKSYQQLVDDEDIKIKAAQEYFASECKDYPDNKASYDNCKEKNDIMNQNAANQITFGQAFTAYFSSNVNGFASGLEWKTVGILALLLCLCACGSSCSKFMGNMAKDPTQFQRAKADARRRDSDDKKKKKKKDSSSDSSDDEKKAKKRWKKEQKALKYGHPFHDGHQSNAHALEYQNMSADGLDPQYQQYGGRAPLPGPQQQYALPQFEGQGTGRPPQFPLPVDMQQQNMQRRPPQGRNAPLMLDNGQGRAQPRRQNPNNVMRVTKETTQQMRGPNGQMMTKRTQQVVEQHVDEQHQEGEEQQYENNMGFNQDSMNVENQYQEQELLIADKTYDVDNKSEL